MFRLNNRHLSIWNLNQYLERTLTSLQAPVTPRSSLSCLRPGLNLYNSPLYLHRSFTPLCIHCRKWNNLSYLRELNLTPFAGKSSVTRHSIKQRPGQQDVGRRTAKTDTGSNVPNHDKIERSFKYSSIRENQVFYTYMRHKENYQKYFLSSIKGEKWDDYYKELISKNKVLMDFDHTFNQYCSICRNNSDESLHQKNLRYLKDYCSRIISELEINETLCLLRKLHEAAQTFELRPINTACKQCTLIASLQIFKKVKTLDMEQIFRAADMLYLTDTYRQNQLMKGLIQQSLYNPSLFGAPEQLVLFFFYVALERLSFHTVNFDAAFQEKLAKSLKNSDIEEVGTVCVGFFRSETPIYSEDFGLLLVEKLKHNLGNCDDVVVSSILKCFLVRMDRVMSSKLPLVYQALTDKSFVSKVVKFVSDVQIQDARACSMFRFISLYSRIHFYPEDIFDAIAMKILSERGLIRQLRLKDIAILAASFTNFSYLGMSSQQLYSLLAREANHRIEKNWKEIDKHQVALSALVEAFSRVGIYPYPLLEELFRDTDRFSMFEDKTARWPRLLYVVSESVKIERPNYKGPLLPDAVMDKILNQQWYKLQTGERRYQDMYLKTPTQRSTLICTLEDALETYLGGQQYFKTHLYLPHFLSPDLGFAVDKTGAVIPAEKWFVDDKVIQDPSHTRIIIVPVIERDGLYFHMDKKGRITEKFHARVHMKTRQLNLLGFEVVHILRRDVFADDKTEALPQKEILRLLHKKLSTYIKKTQKKPAAAALK